jgi:Protein of unknown function (DUF2855)
VDFEIRKADLHEHRFVHEDPPTPSDGEALLRIESFGLTTNNITYAVFGEGMNYWKFFPASDPGWGRLNTWGYAHVEDSKHPDLAEGRRVYGYYPASSHLLALPHRIDARGFSDGAPHRRELPSAYQGYRDVETDPVYSRDREDEQIIFWPLFYTSFLIDDFIDDEDHFGADTIVISSASAKTAIIAAYLLAQREGIEIAGLTSPGNRDFVEGLKIYDSVTTYDEIDELPGDRAAYVDISGDSAIRVAIHEHYGDRLTHDAAVGMTHHTEMGGLPDDLPGPRPAFFFAPDRIRKRGEDWGAAKLDEKVGTAWTPFAEWASGWLEVERISSEDEIAKTYEELLDGKVDPAVGTVVELDGSG